MFIQALNHISAQKPLSTEWFYEPISYYQKRIPTIDPDFSLFFPSLSSRRMCKLLKRAVMLSRLTLKDAGINMPDAIISGTGLGCIENTEKFLWSIMEGGEQFLQPTFFMQSTHNILSSSIAIDLKCHGYNNTFVHRGTSFENALKDANLQIKNKRINTALVGGFDELTDDYYVFFNRIGLWNFADKSDMNCFAGEASVSMLINSLKTNHSICEINDIELLYNPSDKEFKDGLDRLLDRCGLKLHDIDAIMTGYNSNLLNDTVYDHFINLSLKKHPILQYKHLFGESFSASALGIYAAIVCLSKQFVPAFMVRNHKAVIQNVKRILFYNFNNKSHSLILLSSCCD